MTTYLAHINVMLRPLVNDPQGLAVRDGLHALGFEHRHVHELEAVAAVVFHHQQTGARHLEHDGARRNRPGRPPHTQRAALMPHAEVDAAPFDGWRHAHQTHGPERQRHIEEQRVHGQMLRYQGERDARQVVLLASEGCTRSMLSFAAQTITCCMIGT